MDHDELLAVHPNPILAARLKPKVFREEWHDLAERISLHTVSVECDDCVCDEVEELMIFSN